MVERAWWAADIGELSGMPSSGPDGLPAVEASQRASAWSRVLRRCQTWRLFVSQFTSPLVLVLVLFGLMLLVAAHALVTEFAKRRYHIQSS